MMTLPVRSDSDSPMSGALDKTGMQLDNSGGAECNTNLSCGCHVLVTSLRKVVFSAGVCGSGPWLEGTQTRNGGVEPRSDGTQGVVVERGHFAGLSSFTASFAFQTAAQDSR